jgi:hypothetical protein
VTFKCRLRASALVLTLSALPACGGSGFVQPVAPPPPVFTIRVESGWTCANAENCQDVYDIVLEANTELTIRVTQVTGPSVLRLAAYAPGVPLGGTNLLNSTTNERRCSLANAADFVVVDTFDAGTYRVGVGRDWGFSSGANGSYTLDVFTDKPLLLAGQTVNDTQTQASSSSCP